MNGFERVLLALASLAIGLEILPQPVSVNQVSTEYLIAAISSLLLIIGGLSLIVYGLILAIGGKE